MLIKKFRGLYTNIDSNDINLEFQKIARNIEITDQDINTKFFKTEDIAIDDFELILDYKAITLDNDKLQTDYNGIKIVSTYEYSPEKVYLLIANTATQTEFYINSTKLNVPFNKKFTTAEIIEDQGKIIIILDGETYWMGRLDRNYWRDKAVESYEGYYIDRYLEPFDINNLGILYNPNTCKINRRLGFGISVKANTEQTQNLQEDEVSVTFLGVDSYDNRNNLINRDDYVPPILNSGIFNEIGKVPLLSVFKIRNKKTSEVIYTPGEDSKEYHVFYQNRTQQYILVPYSYFFDEDDNAQNFRYISIETKNTPPWEVVENPEPVATSSDFKLPGKYYKVPNGEFQTAPLEYIGLSTIDSAGFDSSLNEYEIIVTSILDRKEELITEYIKGQAITSGNNKYALQIDTIIPENVNERLTGIGYYIRFNPSADFEQLKVINLLNSEEIDYSSFFAGDITKNGIMLLQTIGTLFQPETFQIISEFNYFARVSNLPYMIKNNQVYGGVTGSGRVLDLFYPEQVIPNITNETIVAVSNMNNIPVIHDEKKSILLLAGDSGVGTILYRIQDTVGFAIKNKYDVAVSPDGIAIHTKLGIFIFNGSTLLPLSEAIDDIVKENYENGRIYFNPIVKELYYFISAAEEFYRYDFVDKNWTTHTITKITDVLNASIDHDGNPIGIFEKSLTKLLPSNTGVGTLKTHYSDLGTPGIHKAIMEYRIEFRGAITFLGKKYTSKERISKIIPTLVYGRVPTERIDMEITLHDNTQIYSIEVNEDLITAIDQVATIIQKD